MAGSAIGAVLDALAERLGAELDELETVDVWDGPWASLADVGRLSRRMPAALVSLGALEVVHRARRRYEPGQLRAIAASPNVFPAPGQGADLPGVPAPEPHVRIEVAVTLLASDASSSARSARVSALAERAVPVLLGAALVDVRGTNLYTRKLAEKGVAAFAVVGRRDVELGADPREPARPDRVECIDATTLPPERGTAWSRGAA